MRVISILILLAAPALYAQPAPDHYWTMDEPADVRWDYVGDAHAVPLAGHVIGVSAMTGNGVKLTDNSLVAKNLTIGGPSSFTVAAWAKQTSNDNVIVSSEQYSISQESFRFSFSSTNTVLPEVGTDYVLAVVAGDEGNRTASESTTVDVVAAPSLTYILDSVDPVEAVFSTRVLSSAFEDEWLITVRRSSDNAIAQVKGDPALIGRPITMNSPIVAGGTFGTWLGTDDGFVTEWRDQSGNARNAAQATAENQPRIAASGILDALDGRPAVYSDGALKGMATTVFIPSSSERTAFGVVSLDEVKKYSSFCEIGSAYPQLAWRGGTGVKYSDDYNTFGATIGQRRALMSVEGASGHILYRDGVETASGVDKAHSGAGMVRLFYRAVIGSPESVHGRICTLIVANRSVTEPERPLWNEHASSYNNPPVQT